MNREWLAEMIARHREEERTRPMVVGIIANLSGADRQQRQHLPLVADRRFRDVSYATLERLIHAIQPRFIGQVPDRLGANKNILIELRFASLADFHPKRIVQRIPVLNQLHAQCNHTADPTLRHELEQQLQAQLGEILHAPEFKALEATWRGLHHLLTELPDGVRVRVLNLSKRELWKELKKFKGMAWDHSRLFKRIYEEEFGTLGGQPFSLIIGDYSFSHQPDDCEVLEEMAKIMAACHCVFMAAASPHLFGLRSLLGASGLRAPTRLFNAGEYAQWRNLRDAKDTVHLSLVLPRILLRPPYEITAEAGLAFHEQQSDPENLLWGNPAYAVGADLMRAFALHRGYAINAQHPSGSSISHLPTSRMASEQGEVRSGLEYVFANRSRQELEALGFTTLTSNAGSGRIAYNGPLYLYQGSGKIQLPYLLSINHLAHVIRSWQRHLIGAVRSPKEYQEAVRKRFSCEMDPTASTLQQRIESPYSRIDFSFVEYDAWNLWDPDRCNAQIQVEAHDHHFHPIED